MSTKRANWRNVQTIDGRHYLGNGQEIRDPDQENYAYYLGLPLLLTETIPRDPASGEKREYHHPDETIFRTVHQVCELWFWQMLFDMDRIIALLASDSITSQQWHTTHMLLARTNHLWSQVIRTAQTLQTHLPKNSFNEGFRSKLSPSSGAESIQFRLIEAKAGFRKDRPYMEIYDRKFTWFETLNHMRSARWWTPEIERASESASILSALQKHAHQNHNIDLQDPIQFWIDCYHLGEAWQKTIQHLHTFEKNLLQFRNAHKKIVEVQLNNPTLGSAFENEGSTLIQDKKPVAALSYLEAIEKTARAFPGLFSAKELAFKSN